MSAHPDDRKTVFDSLKHWRTVEAEYEGVKEELECLPPTASKLELDAVLSGAAGILVSSDDLVRLAKSSVADGGTYTRDQLVSAVNKRIDYVGRNVATLHKQVGDLWAGLHSVVAESEADLTDDVGLPLREIREELDEDGNVISSSVTNTTDEAKQIQSALQKAALLEKSEKGEAATSETASKPATTSTDATRTPKPTPRTSSRPDSVEPSETSTAATAEPAAVLPSLEEIHQDSTSGPTIAEMQKLDDSVPAVPHYPDETTEEREMRENMIRYALDEVGPVVAQLDLEDAADQMDEDGDDDVDFDFDSYFANNSEYAGYDDEGDEDDSENEYGISTKRHITDEYHQQMSELEARLNARILGNAGPDPDLSKLKISGKDDPEFISAAEPASVDDTDNDLISKLRGFEGLDMGQDAVDTDVKKTKPVKTRRNRNAGEKKRVSFASELDVAPTTTTDIKTPAPPPSDDTTPLDPVGETIIERTPAKPNRLVASKILERPKKPVPSAVTLPAFFPPDSTVGSTQDDANLAPEVLEREVASHYYRHRNNLIQAQGGFTDSIDQEEEEKGPLMEVDDQGRTKKVSRFRAARLQGSTVGMR